MKELDQSKDQKTTDFTLNKVRLHIAHYKNKKDIPIDHQTIKFTKVASYGRAAPQPRLNYQANYNDLLTGKVTNEKTRQEIIKFAELIIQPYCYAVLDLQEHSQTIAQLRIICTLPEYTQHYANFWIGRNIDSQTFVGLVQQFQRELNKYNISNVIIEMKPINKHTITNIQTELSYT